jgi:hypothetical protein
MTVDYIASCGHKNDIRLSSFANNCGITCKICNGRKLYTTDEIIEQFKKIHKELYIYDKVKYIDTETYVEIGCKTHGYFKQTPHSHLYGNGCNRCRFKTEYKCISILENISGFKFDKCKPKFLKGLELDGYNTELNLAIEYNGIQHYKYTFHFHRNGLIDFNKIKENDIKKRNLCKINGVYLIIVPYWIKNFENYLRDEYLKFEFLNSYNL